MRSMPSVSVIVATRDRPELLRKAIESLQQQTWQDYEVVVADDGSRVPEDVEAVIPADSRFRLLRLPESAGPGVARNQAIEEARGQLVAILDDDDIAVPDTLERQARILLEDLSIGLTFSAVQWFRGEGEPTGVFPGALASGRWPEEPDEVFRILYLESNKIPNTTVMFRRELFSRFRYPEWTRIGEDWFLFLQMAASGVRMRSIRECLVWQRRDPRMPSLVRNYEYRLRSEFEVLRRIRQWLREAGIHEFDSLHRRALSNAFARQARLISRFRGLGLAMRGIGTDPLNPAAWRAAAEILSKAGRRAVRSVGLA